MATDRIEIRPQNHTSPILAFASEGEALVWAAKLFDEFGWDLELQLFWNGWGILGSTQMRKWNWERRA